VIETVIDEYLAQVPEPARGTFQAVRACIHALVPELEECISYGIPAFRSRQGIVAGLAVNKKFCSYYPFSGSVLEKVDNLISGFSRTKSALHFAFDEPLSREIVGALIEERLAELASR
jgi:uncharacterized protein YdhG (YjbR/CyaY superfamily)